MAGAPLFLGCLQSYTNAALSAVEDPEKMLDQTVEDMQNDLAKLRQATAQVRRHTSEAIRRSALEGRHEASMKPA